MGKPTFVNNTLGHYLSGYGNVKLKLESSIILYI